MAVSEQVGPGLHVPDVGAAARGVGGVRRADEVAERVRGGVVLRGVHAGEAVVQPAAEDVLDLDDVVELRVGRGCEGRVADVEGGEVGGCGVGVRDLVAGGEGAPGRVEAGRAAGGRESAPGARVGGLRGVALLFGHGLQGGVQLLLRGLGELAGFVDFVVTALDREVGERAVDEVEDVVFGVGAEQVDDDGLADLGWESK